MSFYTRDTIVAIATPPGRGGEQQGVSVEDFDRRKDQDFWRSLVDSIPAWDRLIQDFNAEAGGRNAT